MVTATFSSFPVSPDGGASSETPSLARVSATYFLGRATCLPTALPMVVSWLSILPTSSALMLDGLSLDCLGAWYWTPFTTRRVFDRTSSMARRTFPSESVRIMFPGGISSTTSFRYSPPSNPSSKTRSRSA